MAGVEATSIDLLIVATVTPDMAFPSTAAILADELGADGAAAYDLSAGCTGFMYALAQAYGDARRGWRSVRSSSAATCSRRSSTGPTARRSSSSATAPGAVVLERVERGRLPRLRARRGRRAAAELCCPAAARGLRGRRDRYLKMNGARGVQVRDPRDGQLGRGDARGVRQDGRRRRRLRSASGERADHRPRDQKARIPGGRSS